MALLCFEILDCHWRRRFSWQLMWLFDIPDYKTDWMIIYYKWP